MDTIIITLSALMPPLSAMMANTAHTTRVTMVFTFSRLVRFLIRFSIIISSLVVNEVFFNIAPGFFHLVDVVAIDAVVEQCKHTLGNYMVALPGVL